MENLSIWTSFIGRIFTGIGAGFSFVSNICLSLARGLGAVKEEMSPDEIGDRAIQASEKGITPEKFENYEKYVEEIKNFELDPERSKEISLKDKQMKSIEINSVLSMEKFGIDEDTMDRFIHFFNEKSDLFNEKSFDVFEDKIKENGSVHVKEVSDYVSEQEMTVEAADRAKDTLVKMQHAKDPFLSEKAAIERVFGKEEEL